MGKRSKFETQADLLAAFARERTWKQADLARYAKVSSETVRSFLTEMERKGVMKLQREEEHPHIYWSVPEDWHPAGVLLSFTDAQDLCRALARAPQSTARDALLQLIIEKAAGGADYRDVVRGDAYDQEGEAHLECMEDGARLKQCVVMTYYTSSRGALETGRVVSPQRVFLRDKKFMAVCHKDGQLKWFLLDNVHRAEPAPDGAFRAATDAQVEKLTVESADGFHGGAAATQVVFTLWDPDARWAVRKLPVKGTESVVPGGVKITATTAGHRVLARFLVGLGDAVTVETPALRQMVHALAEAALKPRG